MDQKRKRPAAQRRANPVARKTKPSAPKHARAKSSRDKVRAYRKRMRSKGMRLMQMWLPDTRTPEFSQLAHLASLAIARSPTEQEDQAFIDSVQWLASEEEKALSRIEPQQWWKEPTD